MRIWPVPPAPTGYSAGGWQKPGGGDVRRYATPTEMQQAKAGLAAMWRGTQRLAQRHREAYLWRSTAQSKMAFWLAYHGLDKDNRACADA